MEERTRPGTPASRAPRTAAAGSAGSHRRARSAAGRKRVRTATRWLAAAGLAAAAAIAAACQVAAVPAPALPESPPPAPPASEHGETPTEQPAGAPAGVPTEQPAALPALAAADVSAGEGDRLLHFPVSLAPAAAAPVTVAFATEDGTATAGTDYTAVTGTLTFPAASTAARRIAVPLLDDAVAEHQEAFSVRLSDPHGATLSVATATASIVDDDRRSVAVFPAHLNVPEGAAGSHTVVLGSQPTAPVTVSVAPPAELSIVPATVVFTASDWRTARTVTVTAAEDDDAIADAPVQLTHAAAGGGYDGLATAVTVTIVENDVPTLAVAAAKAAESDGPLRFAVSLSLASHHVVSVDWSTAAAGDTARAGADYTAVTGSLTFPAGATTHTIMVPVANDQLDEPEEAFTLTLSTAVHATVAPLAASATGTIDDDDPAPELTIADARASESDPTIDFPVWLDHPSGRTVTVHYATADATATASADYTAVTGSLTFPAGATTHTIIVPLLMDQEVEQDESFSVTLSAALGATLSAPTATATITDSTVLPTPGEQPLELASLQVTGGGVLMYPEFDPGILHYARVCDRTLMLQVTAQALHDSTRLTLLRNDPADNHVATASLSTQVAPEKDQALVIELGLAGNTKRYVVHCIPDHYPHVRVLSKTAAATDGLLFVEMDSRFTPAHRAIVDYNGVVRYYSEPAGRNFRPHAGGPVLDGKQVSYSFITKTGVTLLDANFGSIRDVLPIGVPIPDDHDFVLGQDSFLLMYYLSAVRDLSVWGEQFSTAAELSDSVIEEVAFAGTDAGTMRHQWNSWDHLKLVPDCSIEGKNQYAHLNSLQLVDGDVVASFRGCSQVLSIDRSSGTWAVQWKLGGTAPLPDSGTEHLEIVGDPLAEFCAQHQATLTDDDHVVLFDNGVNCLGARKDQDIVTRVVKYDISSGTQATFVREYRRPDGHGYSISHGGVTLLDNGNWLIAWGNTSGHTLPARDIAVITEVDTGGNAVFNLNLAHRSNGNMMLQYRVYHDHDANVTIPLELP